LIEPDPPRAVTLATDELGSLFTGNSPSTLSLPVMRRRTR
jgi:hypothetical protein